MVAKKSASTRRSHTVIDVEIVQVITEGKVKADLAGITSISPTVTTITLRCASFPFIQQGRRLDGPVRAKLVIEPNDAKVAKRAALPDYNRAIACINGYTDASKAAVKHLREAAACDTPGSAMSNRFLEQARDADQTGSLVAARLLAFVAEERRPKGMGVKVYQKSFATRNWEATWELVRVTPTQIVLFGYNAFQRFKRKGLKKMGASGDGNIFIEQSSYDEIVKHEKQKTIKLAGAFKA